MARFCEPCRYHSADDSIRECPQCGGAVKFTLLPPLNEDAGPMAGVQSRRQRTAVAVELAHKSRTKWYYLGGGLAMIALLALVFTNSFGEKFEDRVKKLKPGMPMEQAAWIMGDANQSKPKKYTITFGDDGHSGQMPDFDRPIDFSGSGYVVYEDLMTGVKISYENGIVTHVEETARQGGMRKRTTVWEK